MILVLLLQETSAFNATFSLVRELLEAGERVAYAVGPEYENYVSAQGLHTLAFQPATTPTTPGRPSLAAEQAELDELADLIQAHQIELVLLDQIIWYKAAPFLEQKVPILGLSTTYAGLYQSGTPSVFSTQAPTSKLRHFWDWFTLLLLERKHTNNKPLQKLFGKDDGHFIWIRRYRKVEKAGGRIGWGEYGWRLKIPELILGPRVLDWPQLAERSFAGLCVDPDRVNHPQASERFHINLVTGQRLVYASFGTFGHLNPDRLRFFNALATAADQRPRIHLLIQLKDGPEAIPDLPSNVTVCPWVPQLKVLSQTSVFLTHGGFSSVREAISLGVPMIVLPLINDQFGNSARVVYHGLGLATDPSHADAERLGCLLDQVLEDPCYAQRVMAMRESALAEDEAGSSFVLAHLRDIRQETYEASPVL